MRSDPRNLLDTELLSSHYLFGALEAKDREQLIGLAQVKNFRHGTTIFQKGDAGSSMMIVLQGGVRICSTTASGQEVTFDILGRGSVFGELALLDGQRRSADAIAINDCSLLALERRDFIPYLQLNSQVGIQLLEVLCGYVRRISDTVEGLAFLELPSRLARLLVNLSERHGRPSPTGVLIDLKLSQSDLGALVAASRESVNRLLRLWQEEGLVSVQNRQVTVRNMDMMREYASETPER
jgi:CRP/FNR family cyclic AMP-dependent transcriptional regulator